MVVGRFTPRQLSRRPTTAFSTTVLRHRIASASSPAARSSRGPSTFATPIGALAQKHEHSRLHRWTLLTSRLRRAVAHRIAVPQERTVYQQPGFYFPALAHARLHQRPAWFPKWKPISYLPRGNAPTPSAAMDVDVAADLRGPQCPVALSVCSAVADHGPWLTAVPSLDHARQMDVDSTDIDIHGVGSSTVAVLRPRRSLPRARYRPYPAHKPLLTKRHKSTRSRSFPANNTRSPGPPPVVVPEPTPTPAELWREPAGEFLDDEDNDEADVPEVSLEPRLGDSDVRNIKGGMYLMSLYPSPPIVVRPIIRTWPVTKLGERNSLHFGVDVRSRIVQGPLDRPDGMPVYVEDPVRYIPVFTVSGERQAAPVSSLPRSPPQSAVSDQVPIEESVPVKPPPKTSSRARSGRRGQVTQQHPQEEAAVEKPVSQPRSRRARENKENRTPVQEDPGAAAEKKVLRECGRQVRVSVKGARAVGGEG